MVIKQSEINSILVNKLQESDITLSSALCKKGAMRNRMTLEIICRNDCNCSEKDEMMFTLPEGNISTDIMVIGDIPSEFDGRSHTTMFDADGRLLTVVLDRLGLKRDNIYVTNVCKCHVNCSTIGNDKTNEVLYNCASRFLLREIDLIRPKTIITLGLQSANVVRQLLLELPEVADVAEVRGTKFPGQFIDHGIEVVHTHSPSFILSKSGALYNKYKLDLWTDVQMAFAKG